MNETVMTANFVDDGIYIEGVSWRYWGGNAYIL